MKHIKNYESFTSVLEKMLSVPESDEYGKKIVYRDNNDYMITVDSIEDAGYLVLWYEGKNVGFMSLQPFTFKGKKYRRVYNVEIKPKHRGSGFGFVFYKVALKHLGEAYSGIISYLPERVNKKQIPRIYQKLNGHVEDSDYAIIPKQ